MNGPPTSASKVLVNGATGALGRATLAALGPAVAIAGTRRRALPFPAAIHVPDDGKVDPAKLRGIAAIINCAGRVEGNQADLRAANVDHVRNLAAAAHSAGVRRFVQVSSFAVYGPAEWIGADTPVAPLTEYGRGKAEAERALAAIGGLSTVNLRLPFMFDHEKPALLGRLVGLLRRVPVFPVARLPVCRSMLTYADAAALLTEAVRGNWTGAAGAADPQPFTMNLLVQLMREADLPAPALVRIPRSAVWLVKRLRPALGMRLFAASELAPAANWAADRVLPVGIETEIRQLLRQSREARP